MHTNAMLDHLNEETYTLPMPDGIDLFMYRWEAARKVAREASQEARKLTDKAGSKTATKKPRAVVHISHGMAEHAARYRRFAQALTEQGFIVFANDHRGHGHTAQSEDDLGHYADENGWDKVVEDQRRVVEHIKQSYPDTPLIYFAHSMGSFIGQAFLIRYSNLVDLAVLSSSNGNVGPMRLAGLAILKGEARRIGPRGRSPLADEMSFKAFNRAFKPNRTDQDWLSRDRDEVDAYINDPLCGFRCTVQLWQDLLSGMGENMRPENIARVRNSLPICLLCGMSDPSNKGLRGVGSLATAYEKAGLTDIEIKAYAGGRHEMLNETSRELVTEELIDWMNHRLERTHNTQPKTY